MKIAVAGMGYVGLSNAVLLSLAHDVVIRDISAEKVENLRQGKAPFVDAELQHWLSAKPLKLTATTDAAQAYAGADFVIIATPTDYDPLTNYFDTASVESVIRDVLPSTARRPWW